MRTKTDKSQLVLISFENENRKYSICGVTFDVHSYFSNSEKSKSDILFELSLRKIKENMPSAAQSP